MGFRCGQSINNLAQQRNVLYSTEQKCQLLGFQALTDRRTNVQKLREEKNEIFDVTAILVLQKNRIFFIIKIKHFKNCVITGQNRC